VQPPDTLPSSGGPGGLAVIFLTARTGPYRRNQTPQVVVWKLAAKALHPGIRHPVTDDPEQLRIGVAMPPLAVEQVGRIGALALLDRVAIAGADRLEQPASFLDRRGVLRERIPDRLAGPRDRSPAEPAGPQLKMSRRK